MLDRLKKFDFGILAFFTAVCFLYTVSLSAVNLMAGETLSAAEHLKVYILESVSVGVGFLAAPTVFTKLGKKQISYRIILIISFVVFVIIMTLLRYEIGGTGLFISVFLQMLCLGLCAGNGYVLACRKLSGNPNIGIIVACSLSVACLAQYILQIVMNLKIILNVIAFIVFLMVIIDEIIIHDQLERDPVANDRTKIEKVKDKRQLKEFLRIIIVSICLMTLSAYIDAQLDNLFSVEQFFESQRLFLILGSLLIGVTWDIKKFRLSHITMLIFALIAFLMPILLTDSQFFALDLCIFYAYLGACITYLTLIFMRFANERDNGYAAVMFRVLDNLVTAFFVLAGLGRVPVVAMTAIDIIMLSVVVFMMWSVGELELFRENFDNAPILRMPYEGLLDEERIKGFAQKYSLTDRETEVLTLLLTKDEKGDIMAKELGVSRRGFVSFTTSIYQKTETSSRVGLLQKYMSD